MSDTPRTDAAVEMYFRNDDPDRRCNVCDLARQLERELADARNAGVEEAAKLCDETAKLQSEMAQEADESMVQYRKARAWDASVCAAKIRALKNAAPQAVNSVTGSAIESDRPAVAAPDFGDRMRAKGFPENPGKRRR